MGEKNTPLMCLWIYNLLAKWSSIAAICFLQNKYEGQMKPDHLAYLNSVEDHEGFLAACCNMANKIIGDIYMIGKMVSSGVELMNRMNSNVQQRTAIDLSNTALVILKNEGKQFQ